jgi:hypothetical protein
MPGVFHLCELTENPGIPNRMRSGLLFLWQHRFNYTWRIGLVHIANTNTARATFCCGNHAVVALPVPTITNLSSHYLSLKKPQIFWP